MNIECAKKRDTMRLLCICILIISVITLLTKMFKTADGNRMPVKDEMENIVIGDGFAGKEMDMYVNKRLIYSGKPLVKNESLGYSHALYTVMSYGDNIRIVVKEGRSILSECNMKHDENLEYYYIQYDGRDIVVERSDKPYYWD